jgi:hypothetical protein
MEKVALPATELNDAWGCRATRFKHLGNQQMIAMPELRGIFGKERLIEEQRGLGFVERVHGGPIYFPGTLKLEYVNG